MSKLLDYYGDLEDDFESEPLTLVNKRHPITLRKQNHEPKPPEFQKVDGPIAQRSLLLNLPRDLFLIILDLVGSRYLLSLLDACKALRNSVDLHKTIFQEAFSIGVIPTETYKDFKEHNKICYDRLLDALDGELGPRIHKFTVHEFMSIKELQRVTKLCPNLKAIDFTGIMEPIDFSRYKRYFCGCRHGCNGYPKEDIPKTERVPFTDIYPPNEFKLKTEKRLQPHLEEMSKCYACRDRFQWPLVLKNCPNLFANLTSIRIMYEGKSLIWIVSSHVQLHRGQTD